MEGYKMKLSIVIPAFNEAGYIGKCLEFALKATVGYDAEIIVVDNGSHDETKAIVKSFSRVTLIEETRKGTNQARQAGLNIASGDLVANIDADNLITPKWMAKALKSFEKNPKLVGLSGPYMFYDLPAFSNFLIKIYYWLAYPVYIIGNKLGKGGAVMGGNVVFKKSALIKAGGYNTDLKFYGDDTDTANRLNKVGSVVFDYSFVILSSARRLKKYGMLTTGFNYFINHLWVAIFKKPYNNS